MGVYNERRVNGSNICYIAIAPSLITFTTLFLSFGGGARQPPSGPWHPHSWGFWITHNDAPQSVGLLWTSDRPVAETSTWQHTTLTTNRHPCPPVGFEPTISARERPQTYGSDRAATGTGYNFDYGPKFQGREHMSGSPRPYYVWTNCCMPKLHVVIKLVVIIFVMYSGKTKHPLASVAYPGILFGWGDSTNSVEDIGQRERGSGGGSPLVRGSGGSCNLVQEISYSKIFLIFGTLRLFMMTTNLFVIANVKHLRT